MDTLAFWDVTTDAELTRVDMGDLPARSSQDIRLRVKNRSSQYTAKAVTITAEGTGAWQLLVSTDARTFTGTATVGDLPPLGFTLPILIRRSTPSDTATGAYTLTLRAHATSWVQQY